MSLRKRLFAAEPDTASSNWILATRELRQRRPDDRDQAFLVIVGAAFVAAAVTAALAIESHSPLRVPVFLLLVLIYALAVRVEFEIGRGSAVPTELALV